MRYKGQRAYFPLLLVGQNVQIGPKESDTVGCLCVSTSGRIAIVEPDPSTRNESYQEFVDRMTAFSDMLRGFDWEWLNSVAAKHYYKTEGQAFRIIDLMARAGCLAFEDEGLLSVKVSRGLKTEQHLVIVSTTEADRSSLLDSGEIIDSSMYFSAISERDGLPFLPE